MSTPHLGGRMSFASRKGSFGEGSLDQYLKEISRYPLIDKAEEVRLAQGIRRGEEEALDKLVRSNLRFVVSVAKKYQNQGVPLSDLTNEGNLGLIRAAHKFDETKGIKFISYAVWWIRQAILQALAEQSRIVRVPLTGPARCTGSVEGVPPSCKSWGGSRQLRRSLRIWTSPRRRSRARSLSLSRISRSTLRSRRVRPIAFSTICQISFHPVPKEKPTTTHSGTAWKTLFRL